MNKRGQGWGFDLFIALFLFFAGIVLFYFYSLNSNLDFTDSLDSMNYDGKLISESLLSEGIPENWTRNSVVEVGLVDEGQINQTKLDEFYLLSSEYQRTRIILGTKYNFFINISGGLEANGTSIAGIGLEPTSPKNLIRVSRLTIYNNKPANLDVLIWN